MPDAPSRAAALTLCGWHPGAGHDEVPDAVLADLLAEMGGGDALTLRRGFALERARSLLVRLAAHDGTARCGRCRVAVAVLDGPDGPSTAHWCSSCARWVTPTPTPADLLASLAAALREADDPRAWIAGAFDAALAAASLCDDCRCPLCGVTTISGTPRRCGNHQCGWSGPAAALLAPLMTRAGLDAEVEALRRGRG